MRFLAEASAALAESLDYRTTLAKVVRLAVPLLADWCAVHVLDRDGKTLVPVAVVHADPAKEPLLRELQEGFPVVEEAQHGAFIALRTGQPVVDNEIPDARLEEIVPSSRHIEILRTLGLRASLTVPLVASGKTFGAMNFVSAEPRRYGPPFQGVGRRG